MLQRLPQDVSQCVSHRLPAETPGATQSARLLPSLNLESLALEFGIQLKESGIPLRIGIQNPSSTDKDWNSEPKTVLCSITWRAGDFCSFACEQYSLSRSAFGFQLCCSFQPLNLVTIPRRVLI